MIPDSLPLAAPPVSLAAPSGAEAALRARAEEFEAAFLAQMLGHAGLGSMSEEFGGGIGEEQFASFLRQEQAAAMVMAGGIGLAESIFRALAERADDA
ncbi:MAG: rod-binding protein [Gemmobacter sp.]